MDSKEKFSTVLVDEDGIIERVDMYVDEGIDLNKMTELVLESEDVVEVYKKPNVFDIPHNRQRKVLLGTYSYDTVVVHGSKTIHMLINLREDSDEVLIAPTPSKVIYELMELHADNNIEIKKRGKGNNYENTNTRRGL